MKKWRLLSAEGAWLAPGFCLAPSRLPGLGLLGFFFLPFLDLRLTETGSTGAGSGWVGGMTGAWVGGGVS